MNNKKQYTDNEVKKIYIDLYSNNSVFNNYLIIFLLIIILVFAYKYIKLNR